nr:hypothetical protein CFP56_41658 [Quercus suber]
MEEEWDVDQDLYCSVEDDGIGSDPWILLEGWILRWRSSLDPSESTSITEAAALFFRSVILFGSCWVSSCGSCCLGLKTVRVDLDFEWSCCLGLETERVVLAGNEWENSGSSTKEWEMVICFWCSCDGFEFLDAGFDLGRASC